jgi:methyl-accepting chemotaxis protein
MKLSLKSRFLVPTFCLSVLGMGFLGLLCTFFARGALLDNVDSQLKEVCDLTDQRITTFRNDRKAELRGWSENKLLVEALRGGGTGKSAGTEVLECVDGFQKQTGYYENIALADIDGDVVAASVRSAIGKTNIKEREYFKQCLNGNISISEVLVSKTTGNPGFMIASPVMDKGKAIGVFYGTVSINAFNEIFIDPIKVGKEGYAFMYQSDGMMISHPDKSLILKLSAKDMGLSKMIAQSEGMVRFTWEGRNRLAAIKTNKETGWLLAISADEDELCSPIKRLYLINAIGVGAIGLLMVITILLVSNSTVKPIKEIADALREGADQVTCRTDQIATASRQLAEGASQQASAIEETSSALEEMSSMTGQNAGNSDQANRLMSGTRETVSRARGSMEKLTISMTEISRASEETSRIIKTIDEIAFQTNLLALNAAVEAARAGEAGAGFAVVADEVRNLALRAAEAAKSTAGLIEATVKKVKDGSELVAKTEMEFREVAGSVDSSGELVGEISAASREQAQGIEQVSKAVLEMDEVVEQNAANAEESALVSEEMNVQAERMKDFVNELQSLLDGSKRNNSTEVRIRRMETAG